MGSSELEEWIVELGKLRPEEERAAMNESQQKSGPSTLGASKPLTRADVADLEAQKEA
jgi:hypothetical protein